MFTSLLRRIVSVGAAASMALVPVSSHPLAASAAGSGTGLFGFASPGSVVALNPTSGAVTNVADVFGPSAQGYMVQGFPSTPTGDPATHRLFLARNLFIDQSVFPPTIATEILTIDAVNGGISLESTGFLANSVGSLFFDTDTGALLGLTDDGSDELVQIDPASGSETVVATLAGDGFSNFAFAPASHTAYVVSESFATFPATSQLYAIDTVALTASAGPVLSMGTREIAYDTSSNQLFAITFNLTPFMPAKFVRVDTTTGNATQLGTYNFGAYLEPGIALNSASHTVYATQDVFEPINGPITHIVSINDTNGAGILGPSTGTTVGSLFFIAPSVTPDSIIADVNSALANGAISNAGVARSLVSELNQARAARARGDCATSANIYRAFINDVSAQAGKAIASATASQLVAEAQSLIANCP